MSQDQNLLEETFTGIDLGSSQLKVAAICKKGVEVLVNEANFRQTPNVVGYGKAERLIGEAGSVKLKSNALNSIIAPNRYLGFQRGSKFVKQQCHFCPANICKESPDSAIKFRVNCYGKEEKVCPEQAVAALITEIENVISINKLKTKSMIAAVPDYLTQSERMSFLDALKIGQKQANDPYHFGLVNESEAIAYDYGFYKRNQFEEEGRKVLFVDFGHCKLSCFLCEFTQDSIKILGQKSHRQLGCKNIDAKLLAFYGQLFDKRNPSLQQEALENRKAVLKLIENIEKQRKILSGNSEHDFTIECLMEGEDLCYTMKREEFQSLTQGISNEIKAVLTEFYSEIKEKGLSFNHLELVGGGTRIPFVIKTIEEAFEMETSRTLNSNECIAKGAAIAAAMRQNHSYFPQYPIHQFSNYSVNLTYLSNDKKSKFSYLEYGEVSEAEKTIRVQGISFVNELSMGFEYSAVQSGLTEKICSFKVKPLKDSKSAFNTIQISMQMDENLVHHTIKAYWDRNEELIEAQVSQIIFHGRIEEEKIEQYERLEKEMAAKDSQITQTYELKNEAESLIYSCKDKLETSMKESKDFVPEVMYKEAKQVVDGVEKWFQEKASEAERSEYEGRIKQLHQTMDSYSATIAQYKDRYMAFDVQFQKLSHFVDDQFKLPIQDYPQELDTAKIWLEKLKGKQQKLKKWEEPIATAQELHDVFLNVSEKMRQFDLQRAKYRSRQPTYTYRTIHDPLTKIYQEVESPYSEYTQYYPKSTVLDGSKVDGSKLYASRAHDGSRLGGSRVLDGSRLGGSRVIDDSKLLGGSRVLDGGSRLSNGSKSNDRARDLLLSLHDLY